MCYDASGGYIGWSHLLGARENAAQPVHFLFLCVRTRVYLFSLFVLVLLLLCLKKRLTMRQCCFLCVSQSVRDVGRRVQLR